MFSSFFEYKNIYLFHTAACVKYTNIVKRVINYINLETSRQFLINLRFINDTCAKMAQEG